MLYQKIKLKNRMQKMTYYLSKNKLTTKIILGLIPTTFCIGEAGQQVEKLFRNINVEIGEPPASAEQPISHLFLFDRQMDMISTLMTAFTYESLLNDTFSV